MLFHDRAIIDGPARITREGHLVASARVAKANNIQDYMPAEIGMAAKPDGSPYRIFRPEAEVFAHDAVSSAAHRPITLNHPPKDVDASNWKKLSVGDTGGEVLRDGDFLRLPIMVMDADGVTAARTTHQEFSLGYSADLDMTPGKFGDAEYDGSMRSIRVNHLALCRDARGGPELRIIDERPANLRDQEPTMKKIMLDGLQVDLSDAAAVEVAIGKLQSQLADAATAKTTADTQVATLTTQLADSTAKVTTLEQAVKDAALTPQQLRDAAAAYAKTVDLAKKLAPTATITDAMDEPTIKRAVVSAKLGDAAKDWNDSQVDTSFATMVASVGDAAKPSIHGAPVAFGDAEGDFAARQRQLSDQRRNAWKSPATAAVQ